LPEHPLRRLKRRKPVSSRPRRALTLTELARIVEASPRHHALLFEVAITTGLRKSELAQLSLSKHLDADQNGVFLDGEWTKNGKPGYQHMPARLVDELKAFAELERPLELYEKYDRTGKRVDGCPTDPLLFVPRHAGNTLKRICDELGIDTDSDEGRIDFHALRTTFVTLLDEQGATPTEKRDMARHSSTLVTDLYARSRNHRHAELVNQLDDEILRMRGIECRKNAEQNSITNKESRKPSESKRFTASESGWGTRTRT